MKKRKDNCLDSMIFWNKRAEAEQRWLRQQRKQDLLIMSSSISFWKSFQSIS